MSRIGFQDFLKLQPRRDAETDAASAVLPKLDFLPNRMAAELHPPRQFVNVASAEPLTRDMTLYTLVPDAERGCELLAPFIPGQYVSVRFEIGATRCARPYSLCGPASRESYRIAVKTVPDGLCSVFARDHWTAGTKLEISAPEGTFVYQPLRDEKHILAIAGGSGITPFLAMAEEIANGSSDRSMTILYGCRSAGDRAFGERLDELSRTSAGRLETVYVYSEEPEPGQRSGFMDESLIREFLTDRSSVFVSGPRKMTELVCGILQNIGLDRKHVRIEVPGEAGRLDAYPGAPKTVPERVVLTVRMRGEVFTVEADPKTTILRSLESAGLVVPSGCRSGICGLCRSSLRRGQVFVPAGSDHLREADVLFNQIHPCETFPLTDLELDVTAYGREKEESDND